jgi:hypothetical protein
MEAYEFLESFSRYYGWKWPMGRAAGNAAMERA